MRSHFVVDDMNVVFTREQLGHLIDEFYSKVLEHIPRYCEVLKLVVHQAHFLVDHQNDIHVVTIWCHFTVNMFSNWGTSYHPMCESIVSTLINVNQSMIDVKACQSPNILSLSFNCHWVVAFERNVCILANNFGSDTVAIQMSCYC